MKFTIGFEKVHIGGHIAFDIEKIASFCRERKIILLEDCAHAHGASWNGKKPGTWGDAGIYSFYATKTISTGEGGMLVTKNNNLVEYNTPQKLDSCLRCKMSIS